MEYYTYIHATPEGEIFYVGKGVKQRVYSMSDRPWRWRERLNASQGITMQIVARFETEEEAFSHEQQLIKECIDNGCDLVNVALGGPGPKGYHQSEELRQKKREKMVGYVHKVITCPHCGKAGGETTMKRWHFDRCVGNRPFKSRATVNGVRVYLGYFATKEEADMVAMKYKESHQ